MPTIKKSQEFKSGDLGDTFGSTTRWERSVPRSSVLGWNFPVSLNHCTVEVNIFELDTTLSGNFFRYSIWHFKRFNNKYTIY
jgi:hypothetical protein